LIPVFQNLPLKRKNGKPRKQNSSPKIKTAGTIFHSGCLLSPAFASSCDKLIRAMGGHHFWNLACDRSFPSPGLRLDDAIRKFSGEWVER
jgi:hypothetical protein